jgi:hypothetical protein
MQQAPASRPTIDDILQSPAVSKQSSGRAEEDGDPGFSEELPGCPTNVAAAAGLKVADVPAPACSHLPPRRPSASWRCCPRSCSSAASAPHSVRKETMRAWWGQSG